MIETIELEIAPDIVAYDLTRLLLEQIELYFEAVDEEKTEANFRKVIKDHLINLAG